MKPLFGSHSTLGAYVAGFSAGVLGIVSLVLATLVALALFNVVFTLISQLAEARATDTELLTELDRGVLILALQSLGTNVARALWQVRWGLLVAGVLGLIATWGERMASLIEPRWAARGSFAALALTVVVATIVWVFAQWAQIAEGLAQSPELYYARDMFASSFSVDLAVGLLLGLLLAVASWMVWQPWYSRLVRYLTPTPIPTVPPTAVSSNYQDYAARLHALKRGDDREVPAAQSEATVQPLVSGRTLVALTLLLLLLVLASVWVIPNAYQRVAIRLEHESLYIRAETQPDARVQLHIEPDLHSLVVANLDGAGSVSFTLRNGTTCDTVVAQLEPWVFVRQQGEYLHMPIPLTEMPPGDYCLDLHQEEGWGMYEYTLSHGGGQVSHQLALAIGLLAASTVVVAVSLLGLLLLRLGVIAPTPSRQ